MTTLVDGVAQTLSKGQYDLIVNSVLGTGTVVLSYSVNERPFQNITNASYTGDDGEILDLPACQIKAAITGDSTVDLFQK